MKKAVFAVSVALVSLCLLPAPAKAQPTRPAAGAERGDRFLDGLSRSLKLTEDQKQQVKQVFDTHRQAVGNWRKENEQKLKDLQSQLQDALKAGDKDKIKSIRADMQKVRQTRRDLDQAMFKQLKGVLSDEQMARMRDAFERNGQNPTARLMETLRGVNLTEAQRKRIKDIVAEARAQAEKTKDRAQKEAIWKAAADKIRKDVLTDQQRQKLSRTDQRYEFFAGLEKLKLTDQQRQKITAIRNDTKAQLDKATTPRQKGEIIRAAWKNVHDTVLTDEQRAQLKALRDKWRKEHGDTPRRPASQPAPQ